VLPEGTHLRADNKVFYFDVDQNHRGVFMRISEVLFLSQRLSRGSCAFDSV
jgi:hypothetical protein